MPSRPPGAGCRQAPPPHPIPTLSASPPPALAGFSGPIRPAARVAGAQGAAGRGWCEVGRGGGWARGPKRGRQPAWTDPKPGTCSSCRRARLRFWVKFLMMNSDTCGSREWPGHQRPPAVGKQRGAPACPTGRLQAAAAVPRAARLGVADVHDAAGGGVPQDGAGRLDVQHLPLQPAWQRCFFLIGLLVGRARRCSVTLLRRTDRSSTPTRRCSTAARAATGPHLHLHSLRVHQLHVVPRHKRPRHVLHCRGKAQEKTVQAQGHHHQAAWARRYGAGAGNSQQAARRGGAQASLHPCQRTRTRDTAAAMLESRS